jgi:hypothetical protein
MLILPIKAVYIDRVIRDCRIAGIEHIEETTLEAIEAERNSMIVIEDVQRLRDKGAIIKNTAYRIGNVIILSFVAPRGRAKGGNSYGSSRPKPKLYAEMEFLQIPSIADDKVKITVATQAFIDAMKEGGSKWVSEKFKINLNAVHGIRWRMKKQGIDVGGNFYAGSPVKSKQPKEERQRIEKPIVRRVDCLSESTVMFIKSSTSSTHGQNSEKKEVVIKDFVDSVLEIGVSKTCKKFGLCMSNGSVAVDRLRKAGWNIPPLLQFRHKKKIGDGNARKTEELRRASEAYVQRVVTGRQRESTPVVRPEPVSPIIKGGVGNRVSSLMQNMPKIGADAPKPRHIPSPVHKIKEEKLKIPDFKDRPKEPTPEIFLRPATVANPDSIPVAMFSRVSQTPGKTAKPKTEGAPRFGRHPLRIEETEILKDEMFFLYYSEVQSERLWIECPLFILLEPASEFAKYVNYTVHISSSSHYEMEGNIRRLHPDMHFMGVGKPIRAGRFRTRKPKTTIED